MGRRLFCTLSPACYRISLEKEILKRKLKNLFGRERIAGERSAEQLPNIVKGHSSVLLRRLNGVNMQLQENKVANIRLACERLDGLLVRPGETFSFWSTVGRPTRRKGYKDGLVITHGKLTSGTGGGLCQMGNMIHWLILNSPLQVTELHHHSDALFPDERRRVPFGTGTSVSYNRVDYRFRNDTEQTVQLHVWCEEGELCGELRSEREFPLRYRLVEENHHFRKEGEKYYRISEVYRLVYDRKSGEELRKELILQNHSEVLYDYSLIPVAEIREGQ